MVGEEDASSLRDDSNPLTSKVFESVRSVIPDVSNEAILSLLITEPTKEERQADTGVLIPSTEQKGFYVEINML